MSKSWELRTLQIALNISIALCPVLGRNIRYHSTDKQSALMFLIVGLYVKDQVNSAISENDFAFIISDITSSVTTLALQYS